ncbi:MAG: magnesium-translocating P-type ATPase [Candidatus Obscuribacterales bacterium]|nr:magnesium-translocating P-type ATPase [Candidatus Obscuribacterales bacterium]
MNNTTKLKSSGSSQNTVEGGLTSFWSQSIEDVLEQLGASLTGLSADEASKRKNQRGTLDRGPKGQVIQLLLNQFTSPLVLLLLFAAILSFSLKDPIDGTVILTIVGISGLLGFWQEWGAHDAVKKMLAIVQTKTNVIRDGQVKQVTLAEVVRGDLVQLSAGATIPGDCLIVESKDLFVDEATLTGETYPAEKHAGITAADTPINKRSNSLFQGTHVVSGTVKAVVVSVGEETEFGKISEKLKNKSPESDFERGVRLFGYFLVKLTLIMVITIFVVNVFLHRPMLESFMFSLALAVGLTPQLLPAIISVNLASGARKMAKSKVIVKRLSSIESFGGMNVLCSDKTGTLTEGVVELKCAVYLDGKPNDKVMLYAYLNSSMETGFVNPIDESIRKNKIAGAETYKELDEVPYDFIRKRLSVLVSKDNERLIISKGALQNILDVCAQADTDGGELRDINEVREKILAKLQEYSLEGSRVLGVAYKKLQEDHLKASDENSMVFAGMLVFRDPVKPEIEKTIKSLNELGIVLKIITGDNHLVAEAVAKKVGFATPKIITGADLHKLSEAELAAQANLIDVFAEVEPNQKETIILALKKAGNVVGYIGDGINDASALHAADVGISVNTAVDVAKEAAQVVMMEHDLAVLIEGVKEGRTTFANTLKYIFMATSANFGNMFSMAGASLFLPFLPLLPKQVLLTNLMTDFPEMTIVTDSVDQELVERPGKWDLRFIRRFMLVFGTISSVFDYLTFAVLIFMFKANTMQFRTAWFTESVISACLIVLVVRTRKAFILSRPSLPLLSANIAVIGGTLALPYTPISKSLELAPLPSEILWALGIIVFGYMLTAELGKWLFYKSYKQA